MSLFCSIGHAEVVIKAGLDSFDNFRYKSFVGHRLVVLIFAMFERFGSFCGFNNTAFANIFDMKGLAVVVVKRDWPTFDF